MNMVNQFASKGIETLKVSGSGTGLSLSEVKGFSSRNNLDSGLTSAVVTAMIAQPEKTITPAPDAKVIVSPKLKNQPRPAGPGVSLSGPGL